MGWVVLTDIETGEQEFLGDANQYNKYLNRGYWNGNRWVSAHEVAQLDREREAHEDWTTNKGE